MANPDVLAAVEVLHPGLTELYKANVGGPEEKAFKDSYSTAFSGTSTDPSYASMTWDGPGIIACGQCFALIKGGAAAEPYWYLFDISNWNGQETLSFQSFWTGPNAISHISILGDAQVVPVPAAVWLFGSGLLGLIGVARRRKA